MNVVKTSGKSREGQYLDFLGNKGVHAAPQGFTPPTLNPSLKGFQHDLVEWALQQVAD